MLTTDRAVADLATYAPEQIGRTRRRTPEGYLVCEGVRIARTGPMLYAQKEMPGVEPGPFGSMITVERNADVLFDQDCIASYAGKSVTLEHPPVPVTPDNWKQYSVGVVMDPRRGEGAESEYLLADLLITDKDAIEAVDPPPGKAPKVEVSAGYDSDVEQIRPGLARQTKNVGNHVALVDRARGGPALRIKDHKQDKEPPMATRGTRRILDGIRKAFKNKDEAALEESLGQAEDVMDEEDDGDGDKTIVIKVEGAAPTAAAAEGEAKPKDGEVDKKDDPYEPRFKAIEDAIGKMSDAFEGMRAAMGGGTNDEKPGGEGDKKPEGERMADEAEAKEEEKEAEASQVQDAMSKAEILAPGVKLPTKDSAGGSIKRAAVTDLRRRALKTALADSARKVHVDAVLGGRAANVDTMRPGEVAMLFDAAAAVAKSANNGGGARRFDVPQGPMTASKLQALNVERRKQGRI